jgi:hypothetical protein
MHPLTGPGGLFVHYAGVNVIVTDEVIESMAHALRSLIHK